MIDSHSTNGINRANIINTRVNPNVHNSPDAKKLKEACQQFEAILWSKLWKDMRNSAMSISGSDKERPWGKMEDLSLEMATDDLVESSGGAGLWKMLYDSMIPKLAADLDAKERELADSDVPHLNIQA